MYVALFMQLWIIGIAVAFGFTPIAHLILQLPMLAGLPAMIQHLLETYLVYVIPVLIIYAIYRIRVKRRE